MRRRNIPHRKISIHALCEEGDSFSFSNRPVFSSFLSTPSARRATSWTMLIKPCWGNFYPRPLRGGRLASLPLLQIQTYFYPRPLRGGRRRQPVQWPRRFSISIHALCVEGDAFLVDLEALLLQISIHALCEEGDAGEGHGLEVAEISIHALCEEGDRFCWRPGGGPWHFYPRPLRGGRPVLYIAEL